MTGCSYKKEDIQIHSFDSSSKLPEAWDSFIPKHHLLNREHLSLNEKANLPGISYWYVLLTKDNTPVAAAQFQLLRVRHQHLNEEQLKIWQRLLWRGFTMLFRPKLLVAGHLFRHDMISFYCSDKGDDAFGAYRLYKDAIDKILHDSCATAVLIKDVPEKLITYFQHYTKYMGLRNDISMQLEIDSSWQTINDYEKALKHKYAQRFRKVRSALKDVSVKELSIHEVNSEKDIIYSLYRQVCEKQPARIGMLNADYIPLLKQQYANILRVWGIYRNNRLIAFYSAWVREEEFDMFYIGFDYAYNQELMLYFNILFCIIEEAIKLGKKRIVFGRTALDAKARLGCKPHYLSTFVFIRNRFLRMAVQQLQANAQIQEGAWEQRHPMKETAKN